VYLRAHGDELLILQLQEFIFFGTGQGLLDRIRARAQDTTRVPLRFIVMDFQRVPGLDSSAVASFLRMEQLAQAQEIKLVLTDVRPEITEQLKRGGVGADMPEIHYFESLDHGVEWCEDQLLAAADMLANGEPIKFHEQIAQVLPDAADIQRLDRYLHRIEVPPQTVLLHQGEAAHSLYFIETGEVSVELMLAGGKTVRLRTIHKGTVVGEVAMYMGGVRTASVVTLAQTVAYRLTSAAIAEMEEHDPDLAAALHKWIAAVMAERLADNVRTLEALMD
jgi:SulP family sulfate permease